MHVHKSFLIALTHNYILIKFTLTSFLHNFDFGWRRGSFANPKGIDTSGFVGILQIWNDEDRSVYWVPRVCRL